MQQIINLDRYPLHSPDSSDWQALVGDCREELAANGLFNLPGFLRPRTADVAADELRQLLRESAFTHAREHNIYFKQAIEDLPDDHPALTRFRTVNHTICADQMRNSFVTRLYEWPGFAAFIAAAMHKPNLYTMADPLARVNVMTYRDGEALNWHFDRAEFTTTLLLQAPLAGGEFEYVKDLRSDADPNYDGVASLVRGELPTVLMPLDAGTLTVFRGKNTAHRVTPVESNLERIIAVFSFYENEGVRFSEEERLGFYGRSH